MSSGNSSQTVTRGRIEPEVLYNREEVLTLMGIHPDALTEWIECGLTVLRTSTARTATIQVLGADLIKFARLWGKVMEVLARREERQRRLDEKRENDKAAQVRRRIEREG